MIPFIAVPLMYLGVFLYRHYLWRYILPCPLWTCLRIYCPGCGGTRCIMALLHGEPVRALKYNALAVGALLLFMLYWAENVLELFGKRVKLIPESRAFVIAASGIAVAYIILRNFIPAIAP